GLPVQSNATMTPAKTADANEDRDQRERLLVAVAEAFAEHGFDGLTIERVVELAGVPRTAFDANFADRHEAVEAAAAAAAERFLAFVLAACAAQEKWPLKVKVAIGATLDFAAAAPAQAALLAVD